MWDDVQLAQETSDPDEKEKLIEQFAMEKIQEYNGTIFLCVGRSDQERRLTFCQAAQALGYKVKDEQAVYEQSAETLAKNPEKNILFVNYSMQQYLGEYLDACPAGARNLLLYSRRRGNGASLRMSLFMDFWMERGVDILDLYYVDEKPKIEPEVSSSSLDLHYIDEKPEIEPEISSNETSQK